MAGSAWGSWLFQGPNYLLAALMYTMLARFLVGLTGLDPASVPLGRALHAISRPVLAATALLTPRYAHGPFLPLLAAFWLALLRLAWFVAASRLGLVAAPAPAG